MIQEIVEGIAGALNGAFPGIEVYSEQLKQGLKEPCFFVQLIAPANKPMLKGRYQRTHMFAIQYFPQSETGAAAECYGVLEVLYQALEYINVKVGTVRGIGMKGEYFEEVLTFFVSYNVFVKTIPEHDLMEDLTVKNYAR